MGYENVKWDSFVLSEIFNIESTNSGIDKNKIKNLNINGKIPYITRSDKSNGYDLFITPQDYELNEGNVITIGLDTQVQDALKVAIREENVSVPERYESIKDQVIAVATKHTKKLEIKNANTKREVKVRKHVLLSPEFKEFWDKIKHKTTYSVDFDTDELIDNCSKSLKEELNVHAPKLIYTKSGLTIDAAGVSVNENGKIPPSVVYTHEDEVMLPDIITFLQNETNLTRKTIVRVLLESDTINQFKKNPQEYMESATKIIKREMNHMLIDGIKYTQIDEFYEQELFETNELYGYLEKNIIKSEHSVYDHVIFDSEIEKEFALGLEKDPEVKFYVKLPRWFKINTPLGNYNPDWAVLLDKDNQKKMYFIVETKGNIDLADLNKSIQGSAQDKIKCGKKHFKALDTGVEFKLADKYDKFKITSE